jgi:hypothetical protein
MPRSRGRRPKHRSSRRPTAPRSWAAEVVSDAGRLLEPDMSRAAAEAFASAAVGSATASGPDAARYCGERAIRVLLEHADRRRTRPAAALVGALALLTADEAVHASAEGWAAAVLTELDWARADPAAIRRASVAADPWDDQRVTFLEYDGHVVVVETVRSLGETVLDIAVLEAEGTAEWDADGDWPRRQVGLEEAVTPLLRAARHTELLVPPVESEGYHSFRLALDARLRATGLEVDDEWEPLGDDERQALLDRLFADVELPDDDVTRELADLCLTFADGWLPGGVLAWSPAAVERFLLDWAPRKTFLDRERQELLPAVTYAFVGWALVERGLDRTDAAEAAATALALHDDFLAQYEESEPSPATLLAQRIEAAGIDPRDRAAVEAVVSQYNAEQLARQARDAGRSRR